MDGLVRRRPPPAGLGVIEVTQRGAVATLWLSRPAARNALPTDGWRMLAGAVRSIEAARIVVIASNTPGTFYAGADIAEFPALQANPVRRTAFREALADAMAAIVALPIPTVAAIDGGCFGAGVAPALACDLRIAGAAARFAVPPARLGIGYPAGDVARLVAAVGRGQAARLLFSADTIDADEALRIGLVEQCTPDAARAADALAARIAANAPVAIRDLKRALDGDPDGDRRFEDAFGGDELVAGLAAFHRRRAADIA